MKKIISQTIFLLFLLSFTACNDDSKSTPITYGDAYIFSEKTSSTDSEEKVVYSLKINAYSTNYTIKSVKIKTSVANYTLENNNGFYSYKEGPYDDYSEFIDTYTFNFSFSTTNNTSLSNTVTSDVIQPAEIISCKGSSSSIDIKWNTIENANAFLIQMKDSEGNIIFSNNNYTNQLKDTEYIISKNTGAWATDSYIKKGETYTVEILGILTENGSSNIQAESYASAPVVWE